MQSGRSAIPGGGHVRAGSKEHSAAVLSEKRQEAWESTPPRVPQLSAGQALTACSPEGVPLPALASLWVWLRPFLSFLCGLCSSHTVGHWCQADFVCEASQKTRVAFRTEIPPQCVDFLLFSRPSHHCSVGKKWKPMAEASYHIQQAHACSQNPRSMRHGRHLQGDGFQEQIPSN